MKVLLVNKFHYRKGGSETYYFTLAETLKSRGHEVVFFAMQDEKNLPCEQAEYFVSNASVNGGFKSKMNMLLHMAYSKEAYVKMKKLLLVEQPDLVILNLVHKQITLSIIDAIKEHNPELPIFWTMHDLIAVCPSYTMRNGSGKICEKCLSGEYFNCVKNKCIKGNILMSILSWYEAVYIRKKEWYNRVDLFICPSEFYRNKLVQSGSIRSHIVTMRNPLPIDTVFEANEDNQGYILYFGRLSPEKGVKTLIEAAKKCGCHLMILGAGPQEEELRDCTKGFANIEFKGFQTGEALRNYIKNSKCVVLPSEWYENGPYSAMEAMALGKPLIVSDLGGLPELVEESINGYVFDGTVEDLADCICKLQKLSKESYRKMMLCSLEKAKTMFSSESYAEQLEAYYRRFKR